jgi:integrin alpha 7
LKLGAKKEIILEANVTNNGESAYEAKLFVSHPEGLSYVALQSEKNKTSNIICTSYNDTTLVTCNLGNPYQENQAVTLRFRFEVRDIQEEKIALKVSVNSTSEELSKQTSQTLGVSLQKLASYEIKGETKSSNTFYSGEVKGESAMRHLQDIGPRIIHTYTVHNQGWWNIRDMQVVIRWPYQVYTERKEGGKWLLYLEKEPVIDSNATNYCTVDPQDSVNPLHLNSSGVEPEPDEEDPYATGDSTDRSKPQVRRKRDVADVIPSQVVTDSEGKQRRVVSMVSHPTRVSPANFIFYAELHPQDCEVCQNNLPHLPTQRIQPSQHKNLLEALEFDSAGRLQSSRPRYYRIVGGSNHRRQIHHSQQGFEEECGGESVKLA